MVNIIEHYWQDQKSHIPSTYITMNQDQLKEPAGAQIQPESDDICTAKNHSHFLSIHRFKWVPDNFERCYPGHLIRVCSYVLN